MRISRVGEVRCQLGEGPLWDVAEQALYFADVLGQRLWRYDPREEVFEHWTLPTRVSSLALRKGGGAVVASAQGLQLFDFRSGALTQLADPEAGEQLMLNDGKADAMGRFVVGGVEVTGRLPLASLYSLGVDGVARRLDGGFHISNGPCWSPDGDIFYVADSVARSIWAYDYDIRSGEVANRRLFADTSSIPGIPDGATVDARGRLWTAMCDGGQVVCFEPDGSLAQAIDFPTAFVSSVMFGGPDLDRLFVTSIDAGALASVAAAAGAVHKPDAIGGALFVVDGLDAQGLAEHRYGA